MKVFKRGGFIILDDAGIEAPIPIANFDYQIISGVVKIRDVAEQIGYSSLVADLQDEFGVPVGNAAAISTYFSTLTAAAGGGGDASAANQLTQITELQAIDAKVSTAAKQDAQTTELQSIATNTTGKATETKQDTTITEIQKLTGANAPIQQQLTNPAAVVISAFKKLSFVCKGSISVTIDGNTIVYPQNLGGGSKIYGSAFEADDVSTNAATFNGTGTVFLTIKQ